MFPMVYSLAFLALPLLTFAYVAPNPQHPEITPPPKPHLTSTPGYFRRWDGAMPVVRSANGYDSDSLELERRQDVCGYGFVDCGNNQCCYDGQECFVENNAMSCRISGMGLLSSYLEGYTTFDYGTPTESYYAEIYSSYLSIYSNLYGSYYPTATAGDQYSIDLQNLAPNVRVSAAVAPIATGGLGGSGVSSSDQRSSPSDTTTTPEKKGVNIGMIVGIVVGVVGALIIGIVAFILIRRRKNQNAEAAANQPLMSSQPPGQSTSHAHVQPQGQYNYNAGGIPEKMYHTPFPAPAPGIAEVSAENQILFPSANQQPSAPAYPAAGTAELSGQSIYTHPQLQQQPQWGSNLTPSYANSQTAGPGTHNASSEGLRYEMDGSARLS